jgi:hypothetical protein
MNKVPEPDSSDMAASLDNQAALYYSQGQYAKAEPLYVRALVIKVSSRLGSSCRWPKVFCQRMAALFSRQRYSPQEAKI